MENEVDIPTRCDNCGKEIHDDDDLYVLQWGGGYLNCGMYDESTGSEVDFCSKECMVTYVKDHKDDLVEAIERM
jgi:hypothetical protein